MKTIKVKYGGFETEQQVEECLYNAIYNKALGDCVNEIKVCSGCYKRTDMNLCINKNNCSFSGNIDEGLCLLDFVLNKLKAGVESDD